MKKRMRMAAAVMAAMMGMMTLGGCGTASEKNETAALTESQAEGTDAKQAPEDGKSQDLKEINVVLDWYPNAIHTFIYKKGRIYALPSCTASGDYFPAGNSGSFPDVDER